MIRHVERDLESLFGKCFADETGSAVRALRTAMQMLYERAADGTLGEVDMESAVALMDAARAPYLLRYVFVRDLLRDREVFERVRAQLERTGMGLPFGGSQDHRFEAIQSILDGSGFALVDIGCGAGFHLCRLAERYVTVEGYEQDPDLRRLAGQRVRKKESLLSEVKGRYHGQALPVMADVLLTEVIEHMTQKTAESIVRGVLVQKPRAFVITAPNRDFNRHYLGCGFRHDDHDWEPNLGEFHAFLGRAARGVSVDIEIRGVGGRVGNDHSCLLAVCRG